MAKPYHVEVTLTAEKDIREIWEYIQQSHPDRADQFIGELEKQLQTLGSFPQRCPVIAESKWLGVEYRHLLYGDYRTIYRILDRTVHVLRVIHGARLLQL